jgi:hypothetical protein
MGLAIDTVLLDVHNAATTAVGLTASTPATGDSLSVRSFDSGAKAYLEAVLLQGSGTRQARIISPRLHDNVTGLTFQVSESPAQFLLPRQAAQELYSVDQLTVQLDAAASSDTVAALVNYYTDLKGISADLRPWSEVRSQVINYKTVEVDLTTAATIGQWSDTAITTTENQLKADYAYAVLGFESQTSLVAMGIKGPATGNLRICAPGSTETLDIGSYFIEMEERQGRPFIPVFKANDRANTFLSAASNLSAAPAHVYMICAQLPK